MQEWTSAHSSSVSTLTEFNGHLYSGGDGSNKIQKWNEHGQLVQEWTSAHSSSVLTLTEFNGHLYSGGYGSNKIQKWNDGNVLSLPNLKSIEPLSITQPLSRKKKGELLIQQSELEEEIEKQLQEVEQREKQNEVEFQREMKKLQQTYQMNTTKFQLRKENLLQQQTIVQANIHLLENGTQPSAPLLPSTSSSNPQQSSEPEEFLCPITEEIMKDPVIDNEGISYEREAIVEWLRRGNTTSPSTKQLLKLSDLRPNIALRKLIEDWQSKNL